MGKLPPAAPRIENDHLAFFIGGENRPCRRIVHARRAAGLVQVDGRVDLAVGRHGKVDAHRLGIRGGTQRRRGGPLGHGGVCLQLSRYPGVRTSPRTAELKSRLPPDFLGQCEGAQNQLLERALLKRAFASVLQHASCLARSAVLFERRARKRQAVPAPQNIETIGDERCASAGAPLMFVLAVVRDAVRVSPAAFWEGAINALRDEIDARYGGRVLSDVGFVICCETAKTVSDGLVHALDGGATYQAEFRLLVFRPFVGEVLRCTVEFVDENGLRCTTGFFSQIRIPPNTCLHLQPLIRRAGCI